MKNVTVTKVYFMQAWAMEPPHTCLTDPNLLYCGKPSEVCPVFH